MRPKFDREIHMTEKRSLTPHLPTYSSTRAFLKVIDGIDYDLFQAMDAHIWKQRGSPQANVDWSNPDEWISLRLEGEFRKLAQYIWNSSNKAINPRHMYGQMHLSNKHQLIATNKTFQITERGKAFIKESKGEVVTKIDEYEGLLFVLGLVSEHNGGKRGNFLSFFTEYCLKYTTAASETTITSFLYNRLLNLIDRSLIQRDGQTYSITDVGLNYIVENASLLVSGGVVQKDEQGELRQLAKKLRDQARTDLANYLSTMNPYRFEVLIQMLLQEMGYNNVEVTSPTNDKGVDVVADIQLGISSVREVVQVKRHKGNLSRPVLDQLRGSLHRFNAVRGTIISTGNFSKGMTDAAFERGAAPITLIDGDKLLELLIEYGLGVQSYSVEYLQFDPSNLPSAEVESPIEV